MRTGSKLRGPHRVRGERTGWSSVDGADGDGFGLGVERHRLPAGAGCVRPEVLACRLGRLDQRRLVVSDLGELGCERALDRHILEDRGGRSGDAVPELLAREHQDFHGDHDDRQGSGVESDPLVEVHDRNLEGSAADPREREKDHAGRELEGELANEAEDLRKVGHVLR